MLTKARFIAISLSIVVLSGCGQLHFPGVYKFDIQQGNIITQEMVNQLKPGMTKSQVLFVMGTPLIADSFHQNRWDYLYALKKADGEELREQISILFDKQELLAGLQGDFLPDTAIQTQPEE